MLYLIATPIGNLSDITLRALETLKRVDFILCEDTRTSFTLLQYHGIKKPLKSFHKFNEKKVEEQVLFDLKQGAQIALISDAGTPGISDPGQRLIKQCHEEKIPCTALPGACSPIVALSFSGLDSTRFQFLGFLPKKVNDRKHLLIDALFYPGVSLFFESPQRIHATLKEIALLGPNHRLAITRELTKLHEEALLGTADELLDASIRGEVVVVMEGHAKIEFSKPIEEHVEEMKTQFSLSKQEAIKLVAQLRGVSKKDVYF